MATHGNKGKTGSSAAAERSSLNICFAWVNNQLMTQGVGKKDGKKHIRAKK